MASGSCPRWMDQVLFDLQDPAVSQKLSPWAREFIPSISMQYANWKQSTSRMPFPTQRQRDALLQLYREYCGEKYSLVNNYEPFED